MYLRKARAAESRSRALELVMRVGNVMSGRNLGTISDTEASEIFYDIVKRNEDLILREHEDPETKEAIRKIRITLLPFSDKPFSFG